MRSGVFRVVWLQTLSCYLESTVDGVLAEFFKIKFTYLIENKSTFTCDICFDFHHSLGYKKGEILNTLKGVEKIIVKVELIFPRKILSTISEEVCSIVALLFWKCPRYL